MVKKSSDICREELVTAREIRDEYIKQINNWNTEYTRLTQERIRLERALTAADDAFVNNRFFTGTNEDMSGCHACHESNWNNESCRRLCGEKFKGLVSPISGRRTHFIEYPGSGEWAGPGSCTCGRNRCRCMYNKNSDTSKLTELKADLDKVKAQIANWEGPIREKYFENKNVRSTCCSNDMDCRGGQCYGNIQICEITINEIAKNENEPQIYDTIIETNKEIKELIINIKNRISNMEILIDDFNKIDYSKPYTWVFEKSKQIYNSLKNIYEILYENVKTVLQRITALKISNARISATSTKKNETNKILDDLVLITSPKLNTDFRNLLKKYVAVKDKFLTLDKENNNYKLMIENKAELDKIVDIFNKNINFITDNFNQILNNNIENENDINLLNGNLISLNKYIIDIKNNYSESNKLLNKNEILFDTFNTNSIFKDIINENLNETKTIIIELGERLKEIINFVKDSESIFLKKKDIFLRQQKLKFDEIILQEQELNEKEREYIEFELEKIIEEERLLELKIKNLNNAVVIQGEPQLEQQPMSDSNTKDGIGKLETSLIITGVAILFICLVLYFLRSKPIN